MGGIHSPPERRPAMPRIARVHVLLISHVVLVFWVVSGLAFADPWFAPRTAKANPIPAPPEPRLLEADSLLSALKVFGSANRLAAVQELQLLGSSHRDVLEAAMGIEYHDVQMAALSALSRIGTEEAMVLLREAFLDTTLDQGVRIAAAEALGDARDFASTAMLEGAANRSGSRHFRSAVRKAVRRMSDPDFDRPIMALVDGRLWYRFLREDVISVRIVNSSTERTEHQLNASESDSVLALLTRSTPATSGEMILERHLEISLRDGRSALLRFHDARFSYADTSRYWHSGFALANPELGGYLGRWANAGSGSSRDARSVP